MSCRRSAERPTSLIVTPCSLVFAALSQNNPEVTFCSCFVSLVWTQHKTRLWTLPYIPCKLATSDHANVSHPPLYESCIWSKVIEKIKNNRSHKWVKNFFSKLHVWLPGFIWRVVFICCNFPVCDSFRVWSGLEDNRIIGLSVFIMIQA